MSADMASQEIEAGRHNARKVHGPLGEQALVGRALGQYPQPVVAGAARYAGQQLVYFPPLILQDLKKRWVAVKQHPPNAVAVVVGAGLLEQILNVFNGLRRGCSAEARELVRTNGSVNKCCFK